ncbi:hypothetical protein PPERSA_02258 [Pseudocohnilembus persalinus]|uniref:Phosphate transporter n=1 Tax=Pseudocohnilembus persalinus TaxID=266149 RepID=A0A0V0QL96_PSEPJ|nr:hypothetical protein PPERSA_02258 [Pseudocohnilembus persalinus]|eukprot:KRX02768.1 hypothetical protein PPERSA_02258 [Pseudocohnilembus persalinus]
MKFGKVYDRLKQNPIFQKYLPDAQFLPYKSLKTDIKNLVKIENKVQKSQENQRILNELHIFVDLTCREVEKQISKYAHIQENFIRCIKDFKALKEYCKINKEAIRKIAKKYDKIFLPEKERYLQKQILQNINQKELGSQEKIDILLQKALDEEKELLENENFSLLLQDVHQLHNNQDQILKMLDTGENKATHYIELLFGFFLLVIIPVSITPYLKNGLSVIANIFVLTMPLAFFLGATIGGSYGNNKLSKKQAFFLGTLFELQVLGATTLGGFADQNKTLKQFELNKLNPHDFRAYTEDQNFVTLGISALMTSLSFNLIASSIYSVPISVSKNCIIAAVIVGAYRSTLPGLLTRQFSNYMGQYLSPPLYAFLLTFLIYLFIIIVIKKAQNPYLMAIQYLPIFGFLLISILTYLGLYGLYIEPEWVVKIISVLAGSTVATYLYIYGQSHLAKCKKQYSCLIILLTLYPKILALMNTYQVSKKQDLQEMSIKIFQPLLLFSALIAAFMNGSEDVGKFIKPLVQAMNLDKPTQYNKTNIIYWTLTISTTSVCCGILGLFSRALKTKMTTLNPMQSFVVQAGASFAIIISNFQNLLITPSYCTVGSIMAMVLAENIGDWQKYKKIKHTKKLLKKICFLIPFTFLLYLYNFYYSNIEKQQENQYSKNNYTDGDL